MKAPFFKIIFMLCLFIYSASATANELMHTSAKQAIVVDYDTGMVLFSKNADERMPTSSMSKVMSMYLIFEALKNGRLSLDTELEVSEKAWRKGGSKMFVEVGNRVRVEDLIKGVIVQSGNDATIVLAEGIAGDEDSFSESLNNKAKELGMNDSRFQNASGWPDPDHYSTARDLATLGYRIIADFPEYYPFYSEKEFTYNNIKQQNRNPLLYRNDLGADGIKTGHTEAGGYGLMASAKRDGRRVILVVNGLEDNNARAQESARLMEWGLKGFENLTLFSEGAVVGAAKVAKGKTETVDLIMNEEALISLPKNVKNDLQVSIIYDSPVPAPIQKGDEIGKLVVEVPRLTTLEYPLYAASNVQTLGFFSHAIANLKALFAKNVNEVEAGLAN